jgi:GntR family transcriptional repressor for pyruvate dehydrogenase complex
MDLISATKLKPGDRLPSENSLSKHFYVSRITIREALQQLRTFGVLNVRQGKGWFVEEAQKLWVPADDSDFSASRSFALIEVRKIIEPACSFLAAERATKSDLERIEETLKGMEGSVRDKNAFRHYDLMFHLTLVDAAKNPILRSVLQNISHFLSDEILRVLNLKGTFERAIGYHRKIYEAVKKGQAKKAAKIMEDHVEDVAISINREFAGLFS